MSDRRSEEFDRAAARINAAWERHQAAGNVATSPADREAGTVTYKFHANDYWIAVCLLWSGLAWALCLGAVFLHISGVSSTAADVVAFGVSVVVGLAWCVIVFVAEW